jgi:hypothetical protein
MLTMKIGSTLLFLSAFTSIYWQIEGDNRFLYLACATTAFCAFQTSFLLADYIVRKANRAITQNGKQLLRNSHSFLRENKRAVASIETLKKDLHILRQDTDREVTKYQFENKVKTEILEKKNFITEAITKKAA